jgi:hypothetical protein
MSLSPRHDYWLAVVAQFHRSGLTQTDFCRTRHLSIHSFRQWLYRLRHSTPAADRRRTSISISTKPAPAQLENPAFLPVHIRPEHPATTDGRQGVVAPVSLEVILTHDRRVRIPVGFDPATLRQLLEVLEEQL